MSLTINRNSWHYKLALYGHLDADYETTDLCRYFWALVRGVLKAPLIVSACAGLIFLLVLKPLVMLLVWAMTGILYVSDGVMAAGLVWGIAALMLGMFYLSERGTEVIPGAKLVAAGYRGWKQKTCVIVELE